MEYGLIGAKLGHSYSVPIHAQLGNYDYRLYERTEEAFVALLKSRDFKGLNVTIPYKQLALRHCDALSDTAREVGSVNTLVVRPDGSLHGHNTDIGGFIALAAKAGVVIAGRKVVKVDDFTKPEETGLPSSNVLRYTLEDETWVTVRPSGTEPKLKLYLGAHAENEQKCDAILADVIADVDKTLSAWLA